jgi:hypothetical protein
MDGHGRYKYEPRRTRLSQSAVAFMMSGLLFGIAAAVSPTPWRYAVIAIGVLAMLSSVARGWRIGLWADNGRVRVCNYWRTFEFSWADVTEMYVGSKPAGDLFTDAWRFTLSDGAVITAQATPSRAVEQRRELEALLATVPTGLSFRRPVSDHRSAN